MSHSSIALATLFIRKFNTGLIGIDEFDCFIIDNGMAKDPKTDDVKSLKYKGFVNQRAAAKRTLNGAGAALKDDNAFMIQVKRAGEEYEVVPFSLGATMSAEGLGDKVRLYTENRQASIGPLKKKIDALLRENPRSGELLEASEALALIDMEARRLIARVDASVNHFNKGLLLAQEYAAKRVELASSTDSVLGLDAPEGEA